MTIKPRTDFATFKAGYDAGRPQVVAASLIADLETPVSAMLKLADGKPMSFLLESVTGGAIRGRYSIIGLKPDLIWRCFGDKAEINRTPRIDLKAFEPHQVGLGGALASLREILAESRIVDIPADLRPIAAGLFGYMGYDMVRLMERLPQAGNAKPDPLGVPDGMFIRPTLLAIFDNIEDSITLVTPVWPQWSIDAAAAWQSACERLADAATDFTRSLPFRREPVMDIPAKAEAPRSFTAAPDYMAGVERAKDYIRAGDIFQVVLSQRFSRSFTLPPMALYRALRRLNPSPFLFYLDLGEFHVVGSSPEILVRLRDDEVTIRPIAGTRWRGKTPAEDKALEQELLADPKECAEHLMLLDLGRNDVGRVAEIGTVRVTEQFTVERYSHVMHIVSNVVGKLRSGLDALAALAAGFPAGTVSGAPKVRAMEIIDEIEPIKRGIYGGCIGYFAASGDMDTCIALRTAVLKDGHMFVQAGGGIVADSVPEAEHQESVNKAKALFRAAEEAVAFSTK